MTLSAEEQEKIYRFFTEVGIIQQLVATIVEEGLPGRMSNTQFGLIGHILRRPNGETPLQLANAFQVPKTSMTHMLAVLEKEGLITLAPNPADARSKLVRPTEKAGPFMRENMQKIAGKLGPIVAQLGPEPFLDSLPALETIRAVLDATRD